MRSRFDAAPADFASVPSRALALVPTDLDAIGGVPTGVEVRRWVPQLAILLADTLVELGVVRRLDTAAATARALPGRPTSSSPSCADASDGRPSPWWGRAPVVVQR